MKMRKINKLKKQGKGMKTILIVFAFLISISFVSALNSCVGDPLATPYTGSTIDVIFNDFPFSFSSRCGNDPNAVEDYFVFYYCNNQDALSQPYSCECDGTKCLAESNEVFYWIRNYGQNHNFYQVVDDNFIESVITSWIEN